MTEYASLRPPWAALTATVGPARRAAETTAELRRRPAAQTTEVEVPVAREGAVAEYAYIEYYGNQ